MASFETSKMLQDGRYQLRLKLREPVVNLKIVNRKRRAPPNYAACLLMRLPPEIHSMLFDLLDGIDRICLLLTCKYFTRVGASINAQEHWIPLGQDLIRVNWGFSDRIPRRLRLCMRCGIMRPKDTTYWDPHRCGWDWRKVINEAAHEDFGDRVNDWGNGQIHKCPRCCSSATQPPTATMRIDAMSISEVQDFPGVAKIKPWPLF